MKKGWQPKTLGEICVVDWGNTGLTKSAYVEGGKFLAVSAAGCDGRIGHMEHVKYTPVLSAIGAQCGRMFLPEEDFTAIKNTITLTPQDGVCTGRFLYQLLTHIELPKRGAAQPFIAKGDILKFAVPLPTLAEQQRLVGILDEAFAGLATAKATAEKNLQNARALFESHLQSVFTQRGKGWVETAVKAIAAPAKGSIRTGPFGSQLLHSEFVEEGIAVLGIDNAVANEFRWGKDRFITPEKYRQLKRYTVRPGDVLITIMGTCGRCAIVPDDIPAAINTKHLCCITLDRKQCLPSYLHLYFLHAPQSQEFLTKHAKGSIMAGLNMGLIQELPVVLPPVNDQAAIAEAAGKLRLETQRLASLYQQKLAALEALKKSLLHQAFSGAL